MICNNHIKYKETILCNLIHIKNLIQSHLHNLLMVKLDQARRIINKVVRVQIMVDRISQEVVVQK